MTRLPTLRTYTMTELIAWWRSVECPKCHAPKDAPCADHRSYDKDLYGARVHRERKQRKLESA